MCVGEMCGCRGLISRANCIDRRLGSSVASGWAAMGQRELTCAFEWDQFWGQE